MRKSRALLVSLLVSLSFCACSVPLVSVTCLCKARGETKSAALYGTEPDARGTVEPGRGPGPKRITFSYRYMEYALKSVIVYDTFYFLRDSDIEFHSARRRPRIRMPNVRITEIPTR